MEKLSDETIMAYVDGELDTEQSTLVREALQSDPVLMEKADLFRETTSMLDGIYDAPLHEEVPECLTDSINAHQLGFSHRIRKFFHDCLQFPAMQPAFASAIVAGIIIGAGFLYKTWNPLAPVPTTDTLVSSEEFSYALEKTPGGQSSEIKKYGATVTPVITFRDKEHRFCRQYEVITESGTTQVFQQGIACRDLKGAWETVTFLTMKESMSQHSGSVSYELSGSENIIDEAMDQLRAGAPLTSVQELEHIHLNWKM
jgi:hypothetical protein